MEELDTRISRLEKDVESGTMKLVDEKKALAEVSSLKKLRRNFASFEDAEKGINDVKAQIAELKKTMDSPEAKALSEKYNTIAKELDDIKASQDEAFKSINSLRDERTKLQEDQQAKFSNMRSVKDKYYEARNAHRAYEQELYKQRQERRKAENEAYAKEKRKKAATARLEEASAPAYMDEIMTAEGLINYFDPSSATGAKSLRAPSGFAAEAQRTVDDSAIKGTALSKKEDRDDTYFMGGGGKKGKKGKKGNNASGPATSTTEGKFNLSIGVIEELAKVNINPPTRQADVPEVLEKLKAKVAKWKSESDAKTKEVFMFPDPKLIDLVNMLEQNVAKAQAEIDRLEADAQSTGDRGTHDTAKKPAIANAGVNGEASASAELAQEEDAAKDVAAELEKAKIEDAQEA